MYEYMNDYGMNKWKSVEYINELNVFKGEIFFFFFFFFHGKAFYFTYSNVYMSIPNKGEIF